MKKIVKITIMIFLLFLVLQLFMFIFKTKHNVDYEIKLDDMKFNVSEKLSDGNYYIKVSYDDYNFSFKVDDTYYKSKKIVDDIYTYSFDDYLCIFPVLEKDIINIMCSDKSNTYSYVYLEDKLDVFVETLEEKGYLLNSWDKSESNEKKLGSTIVYQSAIPKDTYIYIWKYNGFYTISNEDLEQLNVFKNDTYVNDLGVLVGKYYMIPDYNQKYEFDKFYVYNITNNKVKTIKQKMSISFDSYINGVKDGKVYLFDKDSLVQYEINPKSKKVKEVGNKKDGVLYFDGDWKSLSVYDFRDNELTFKDDYSYLEDVVDVTSLSYVFKNDEYYYYLDSSNDFYVYDSVMNVKMKLFNFEDISYITNVDDDIYFVKDNVLYLYNNFSGISKILVYDELRFNTINRISIYKK